MKLLKVQHIRTSILVLLWNLSRGMRDSMECLRGALPATLTTPPPPPPLPPEKFRVSSVSHSGHLACV